MTEPTNAAETPAQRLTAAAKALRSAAHGARAGAWRATGADGITIVAQWAHDDRVVAHVDGALPEGNRLSAAYIALMDPRVGKALADWLDMESIECEALVYHRMTDGSGIPRPDAEREVYAGNPGLALADLLLGYRTTTTQEDR